MEEKFKKVIELFKEQTKRECYKIVLDDEKPTVYDNKLGGVPYLPIDVEYPVDGEGKPMALLFQVDMKDVDLAGYPKAGILQVYLDSECGWPCQYTIKYLRENLPVQENVPNVTSDNFFVMQEKKFHLEKAVGYMSFNDFRFADTISKIVSTVYGEQVDYCEFDDFFGDFDWLDVFLDSVTSPWATIGGWADFTQSDPREYKGNEHREMCLFKLDSNLDNDVIMVGDSGIVFGLISQKDIENCNFDEAVVDWDCC